MALNKIYDTPFERLCLEYTPDFSTEEPRKWLEETYNRKGYLNIGDEFIYYNENNGIEKLIRGKVVDKDKYVINRMGYKFNNICLTIFCRERDTKRALEINEEQLAKAKMLGSTLFNKKDFIPYHNYIFETIHDEIFYEGIDFEVCLRYIADEETERIIVNYLYNLDDKLIKLYKDCVEKSDYCHMAIVDNIRDDIYHMYEHPINEKDIWFMIKIPDTNLHLVIFEEG